MIEEFNGLDELPQGWIQTQLGEIAEVILGQSPPSSTYNEDGRGLPFYQGKLEFGKSYPTPRKWCTAPKKIAEKGDVLISVRAPVGPTNVCPEKSCIGRGLAAIRGLGGIETLFILYLLRVLENEIARRGTGTTFSAIGGDKLKELKIPLPPFNEQVRIVARLEELFARLDAGVEGLRKVKAQLKRYRQAVLKYAFEGKLTEEWRKTHKDQIEPAIELLERVKHRKARSQKPLPIEESDLFTLPEDWAWTAFGEISQINMGQSPSSSSYNNSGHGTPLLNGPTEFGEKHPIAVQWTTSPTKICKKGDLLICVRGNTTGRMNWADQEYCIGRGLAAITPLENVVKCELLSSFLLMKVGEIMRRTRGSTFPNLKSDELHKFPFPLAPYAEQEELVARMRDAFSAARELERNMATSLSQSERLRQSIFKAAFEGELVPQDPSDEPAGRLLERVKAERAKSKGEKDTDRRRENKPRQLELSTYVK